MARKAEPIKKVPLQVPQIDANGKKITERYRFVIDVGKKPRIDKATGKPMIRPDGQPVMTRDQRTFTFDKLSDARAEWNRIKHERGQGTLVKPDRKTTVDQLCDLWLATKADLKPSTVRSYVDALASMRERHGHVPAQQITEQHIEALKAAALAGELRKIGPDGPLARRTINLQLQTITSMFAWGVEKKKVAGNPAAAVARVRPPIIDPDDLETPDAAALRGAWQLDDAVAFLRSVRESRQYVGFLLAALGPRRGEVLGLRWDRCDLTGERADKPWWPGAPKFPAGTPTIAITRNRVVVAGKEYVYSPKSRGGRRVLVLPQLVAQALKQARKDQAAERLATGLGEHYNPLGYVVVDADGTAPRPQTWSERWDAAVKVASLPRIPLHGARHCAASLLGDMGLPLAAVAAWLGQSQVSVTAGYTHAMAERITQVSTALGDALSGR